MHLSPLLLTVAAISSISPSVFVHAAPTNEYSEAPAFTNCKWWKFPSLCRTTDAVDEWAHGGHISDDSSRHSLPAPTADSHPQDAPAREFNAVEELIEGIIERGRARLAREEATLHEIMEDMRQRVLAAVEVDDVAEMTTATLASKARVESFLDQRAADTTANPYKY